MTDTRVELMREIGIHEPEPTVASLREELGRYRVEVERLTAERDAARVRGADLDAALRSMMSLVAYDPAFTCCPWCGTTDGRASEHKPDCRWLTALSLLGEEQTDART